MKIEGCCCECGKKIVVDANQDEMEWEAASTDWVCNDCGYKIEREFFKMMKKKRLRKLEVK